MNILKTKLFDSLNNTPIIGDGSQSHGSGTVLAHLQSCPATPQQALVVLLYQTRREAERLCFTQGFTADQKMIIHS